MKTKLFAPLFALPVSAGVCAAILRAVGLRSMTEGDGTLLYGLIAVTAVAFLMAAIAAFLLKDGVNLPEGFLIRGLPFAFSLSAAVIVVYAGLVLLKLQSGFSALDLIVGLFSVYCAVSLIVLGKYQLCERDNSLYCIFSAVPSMWSCFLLILAFREKVADPIISNYVFHILSGISILFFCYSMAGAVLGKKKIWVAVFSCFLGIFFILIELLAPLFVIGDVPFGTETLKELLPQLAFLIIMPFATAKIIKK